METRSPQQQSEGVLFLGCNGVLVVVYLLTTAYLVRVLYKRLT